MTMDAFLKGVSANALRAGVFGEVKVEPGAPGRVSCAASASAEPAWYRVEHEGPPVAIDSAWAAGAGRWHVSLVTPDRWLSESIEADLMHHGDPLEELIEEELVELGFTGGHLPVQHYRSDDMLYTFRSPIPLSASDVRGSIDAATKCLLAYEAAFRELGDMSVSPEK